MKKILFLALGAVLCRAQDAQYYENLKVEQVAKGFNSVEGPVWSRQGFLYFSDYGDHRIYKYVPGKGTEVFRDAKVGPNGNAFDRQGRLYNCEYLSRRVTRTDKKGKIEVLAATYEGKRLNAPNDIIVRKDGHVYFTDPLYTPLDPKEKDLDFFGVYHVTPKGQLELIQKYSTRPNGITMTADGKTLYVANTNERNIRAFDLDKNGKASNERVLIPNLEGGADGIKVDVKGNLYLSIRGVQIYSPMGVKLGSIKTPEGARNLAFGDPDFKTLYITGGKSLYRVRLDVAGAIQVVSALFQPYAAEGSGFVERL